MKKLSVFIAVVTLLTIVSLKAQVTLNSSWDFEDGLPTGWTSSSSTNVTGETNSDIAINGYGYARIKHGSADQYLQTALITVPAGQQVRLEFNHIPMTNSSVRVQLVSESGTATSLGGSNVYDNKFRPGISSQGTSFKYTTYYTQGIDISKVSTIKSSMWQHEVFYLTTKLNNATTFYIRFTMPTAADNGYGWLIDDVKIYTTASSSASVPRFNSIISCPNTKNYPYCSDAEVEFQLSSQTSTLSNNPDSICLKYYTPGDTNLTQINLTKNSAGNYAAIIPYLGIDSTVYWRAEITDAFGNQTTYPFTGNYQEFTYVRPYTGDEEVKKGATASEALIFSTKYAKVSHQVRYSAKELQDAGYTAGLIGGFYLNIKSRPSGDVKLDNFKVYLGAIDSADLIDAGQGASQYANVTNYINKVEYALPDTGWQYLPFEDDKTFIWDGESDIILKVCFDGSKTYSETKVQSYSSGNKDQYKTHRLEQGATATTPACTGMFNTDNTGTVASKPNIRFNFINKCYFNVDAGIRQDTLLSPLAAKDCDRKLHLEYTCKADTDTTLKVMLRNDGLDTLTSVKVKWMLDDDTLTIDSSLWTGVMLPLDPITKNPQDTAVEYTATTTFKSPEGVHILKIWTEMPDTTLVDWNFDNDTLIVKLFATNGAMKGDYAIGGKVDNISSERTYPTFYDAFIMLINAGVEAHCRFQIAGHPDPTKDTVYRGEINFPTCIKGLSETNDLSFVNYSNKAVIFVADTFKTVTNNTNLKTDKLFDLQGNKHFSFSNLTFALPEGAASSNSFDMIRLDSASSDILFLNCKFLDTLNTSKYNYTVSSLININSSSDITISNCTFDVSAKQSIKITGTTAAPASKITISESKFNLLKPSNMENAIYATNVDSLRIGSNTFTTSLEQNNYSNLTSVLYAVSLMSVNNSTVSKNKFNIQTLSAMSLSSVQKSIFDNNLISLENVNTNAVAFNQYGIYLQSGDSNVIAYNNVYSRSLNSSTKKTYGIALGTTGVSSLNNKVKNNILVSEGYGYAVSVRPYSVDSSFYFSNNFYYKKTTLPNTPLFSYNGANSTEVEDWKTSTKDTNSFYDEDPLFTSWENLFSSCISLCENGEWIDGITKDYYGNLRPNPDSIDKKPCIGAREFDPPLNNIYVLMTGLTDYEPVSVDTYADCNFEEETVFVEFKNVSTNTIPANTLQLNYSVDGNLATPVLYTDSIEPNVVKHFDFPQQYNFIATDGNKNFEITAFSILDVDSIKTNDTANAQVISYYRLPAFEDQNINVKYGNSATIDVSSLCPNDSVYWFYTPDDTVAFYKGHSFETENLYTDSTIYFARRDEVPILRISEVQFYKDASKDGITQNLPNYVSANNAYEIANCGSEDIEMGGYQFVSYSAANITKANGTYTFPQGYVLKGHSSVVMVATNSVSVSNDVAIAVDASKFKFSNASAKGGLAILNPSGKYIDALTFNGATFAAAMNVPTSVWNASDGDIIPTTTSAGIIRTNVKSNSATGWILANEYNPMTMGTYNTDLTDSTENLCLGYLTAYHINITDVPNYDPGISEIVVNDTISSNDYNQESPFTSCGLNEGEMKVTITNTGLQDLTSIPLVCEIYDGQTMINTFNAEYTETLKQFESVEFTFDTKVDLTANDGERNITIKVYTSHEEDIVNNNDTMYLYIRSLHTPIPPTVTDVNIDYAQQATLTAQSDYNVLWYEDASSQIELAEGDTYQTPVLYENTTYYVESFILQEFSTPIGKDSALVTASAPSPSPFNAKMKNIKEQYLIKADSLIAYGYSKGNIKGFAANISNVSISGKTSVNYSNYNVKIGTTEQNSLTTWVNNLTTVYDDTLMIPSTYKGWRNVEFDEPYYWDGVSNIVMEVCFSVEAVGTVTTYTKAMSDVSSLNIKDNAKNVCDNVGTPTTQTKIPYLKFNMDLFGCHSERVPVNVIVENAPECDAGIVSMSSPDSEEIVSGVSMPVSVEIKNYGTNPLSSATIKWKVNSEEQSLVSWTATTPLAQNGTATVVLGNYTFASGLVTIEAEISVDCDNIAGNDTISQQFAACLGSESIVTVFTIDSVNGDYQSISEAVEDLKISGICGPIEFNISEGIYNEQVSIPMIKGTSETNTITFIGSSLNEGVVVKSENADGETTITDKDYLLKLDNASNIYFRNIIFSTDTAYKSVVELKNTSDIHFNNVTFESAAITNPTTVLVNMTGADNNVFFVADTFTNGATSIFTEVQKNTNASTLQIDSCVFTDFKSSAAIINDYDDVLFRYNQVKAHSNDFIADALRFTNISGTSEIAANEVVLSEGTNKARSGLVVRSATFSDTNPLLIVNNSVSITGPAKSTKTHGIDVDSSSFVNIYYNTVSVNMSSSNTSARSLFVGKNNTNIIVRNNNLDNRCGGYAYYVEGDGSQILVSDNNNYYTKGTKFTYWSGKDCATVAALQTQNTFDANSISVENKFRSDTCLDFLYPTDIIYKAEPLDECTTDIYGYVRPVSPKPTIGAYEYQFTPIDAGVVRVISPVTTTSYIEGDPINVQVVVKNFGSEDITSLKIKGVLMGHEYGNDVFQTIEETYTGNIASLDTLKYTFTEQFVAMLNTPYTDSLYVQLYTELTGDTIYYNDTMSLHIKVIPGKDLTCTTTKKQDANNKCGVNMRNQKIEAIIKNVGNKAVVAGDTVYVTYEVRGESGGLKAKNTEKITFPYTYTNSSGNSVTLNSLQPNATIQYFTFAKTVNLEPTGDNDTTWSIKTYVKLIDDSNPLNDTSAVALYYAFVSPKAPIAHDTSVYYGTYGEAYATHEDSLAIRWYHDTTNANPFYKPTKYDQSTTLKITVPLYEDTSFYVNVISKNSGACPSDFTKVNVTVKPRCQSDIVAVAIVEPPAQPKKGYIFMSEDTVKVKLTNNGTQTQKNFSISCSIRPTVPANSTPTIYTETCDVDVMMDDTVIYAFKHLFDFTEKNTTYELKVWTDNPNDCVTVNDTTPAIKVVPLFSMNSDSKVVSNPTSLDITRVQLAAMDNISASLSDSYSDFTQTVTPPELFKGLKDSLLINIETSSEMKIDEDVEITGWVKAWIDWNRDGTFDTTSEQVYSAAAIIGGVNRTMIEVPDSALNGYTLMRVIVSQDDTTHKFGPNPGNNKYAEIGAGEIEDYKIHVSPAKNINAELTRFVTPERLDTVVHSKIVVRLRNAGKTDLTSAKITWIYESDTNEYEWTGMLHSSDIEDVELAEMDLALGHNHFIAYVDVTGDEYSKNDTIIMNNYVQPIYTIPYSTEFDETEYDNYDFYAYESDPKRPTNIWQMGTPDAIGNDVIKSAFSKPTCWKTNIEGQYVMNNTSILYSPIFNIEDIKPDTLSFMMRKDMGPGATMVVEYMNYKGYWKVLGTIGDPNGINWYDSEDGFTKTNVGWEKSSYSMEGVSGDLGKILQIRFVFTSLDGHIADGVAIDNFKIERALRDYDAGVTKIELTPDELPSYGQYFYPKVTIHNYGKKDLTSFKVCYLAEDMYITQCEDVTQTIPVGEDIEYTFTNGRYLSVAMPDPFSIMAYTRLNPNDLYTDNDTAYAYFVIGPLMNDIGLLEITEPLTKVASNDNVQVAVKLKNYGIEPVEYLPIYYSAGDGTPVKEVIHFVPELNSGDEYIYTFNTPYYTPFGTVNLKVWSALEEDSYPDNDTLYKRLQSTNTTLDVEAKYITLDDVNSYDYGLQVAVVNHSSTAVGNIWIGYYLNGDKEDFVEELFRSGADLKASATGYHMFSRRINKEVYQSVCAYVRVEGDENTDNDTTCSVYLGYRDMAADSIFVEQNVNPQCKVQLIAHHVGTLAGKGKVRACYVLNGDYSNIVKQTFEFAPDEPDGRGYQLTFDKTVPRNENSQYNIVAWVEYEGDNNHLNDTTSKVKVQAYVGLEQEIEEETAERFVVEQNRPNPFAEQTVVEMTLPTADEVSLIVQDNNGRVVYSYRQNFSEGVNYINLPLAELPAGTYYYTVRYQNHKITKKMIKIK